MSDELNQIVDLEYTWGDFPALTAEQIYRAYDARDVCAQVVTCNGAAIVQLETRINELKRDNANQAKLLDALRETIGQMEHEADTQHAAALDLQAQRDQLRDEVEQLRAELENVKIGANAAYKERDETRADNLRLTDEIAARMTKTAN